MRVLSLSAAYIGDQLVQIDLRSSQSLLTAQWRPTLSILLSDLRMERSLSAELISSGASQRQTATRRVHGTFNSIKSVIHHLWLW